MFYLVTWKYLIESFVLFLQNTKTENIFNICLTKKDKNHLKMEFLSLGKKKLQTDKKYNMIRDEVRFQRHDKNSVLKKMKLYHQIKLYINFLLIFVIKSCFTFFFKNNRTVSLLIIGIFLLWKHFSGFNCSVSYLFLSYALVKWMHTRWNINETY